MKPILNKNFSQCQNALKNQGFCLTSIKLPPRLERLIEAENFSEIDTIFEKLLRNKGELFEFLTQFSPYIIEKIEHIISLRDAKDPNQEDGIWHDDGSRVLAFSLSLTKNQVKGGVLEFKHKNSLESFKIKTPAYGEIIIFKTGHEDFEHKINKVTHGKRLIIAGWLYKFSGPDQ